MLPCITSILSMNQRTSIANPCCEVNRENERRNLSVPICDISSQSALGMRMYREVWKRAHKLVHHPIVSKRVLSTPHGKTSTQIPEVARCVDTDRILKGY